MDFAAQAGLNALRRDSFIHHNNSLDIDDLDMPEMTIDGPNFLTDLEKRSPAEVQPNMLVYTAFNDVAAGVIQDPANIAVNRCHIFWVVRRAGPGPNFVVAYMSHSNADAIVAAQHLVLGVEISIPATFLWEITNNMALILAPELAAFNIFWNPLPQAAALPAGFAAALGAAIGAVNGAGGGAGAGGQHPHPPVPHFTPQNGSLYDLLFRIRHLFTDEKWALLFLAGQPQTAATINLAQITEATEAIFRNEGNEGLELLNPHASPFGFRSFSWGTHHSGISNKGSTSAQLNYASLIPPTIYDVQPQREKLQMPIRALTFGLSKFFGQRTASVCNDFISLKMQAILSSDDKFSTPCLIPAIHQQLNLLKQFDLPAAVRLLPAGADLETHIRQSMLNFITITDESPVIKKILKHPTTAEFVHPSGSTFGDYDVKNAGGGGGGGGGVVTLPLNVPAAAAIGGGIGVKRNAAGVPMNKVAWLRLAPVPAGVRICWNWARGIAPCKNKNGSKSVCSAISPQQHMYPVGVDKKLFLAWLAQKPN
jgi:hypothetical protein